MQIYGEISTYMALPAPSAPPCDPRSEPRARPRSAHDGPSCNRAAVLSATQREGRDSATFDPRTWRGWRAAPAKGSWGAHTITSTSHDHDHDHEHDHERDHDEDQPDREHEHDHEHALENEHLDQHTCDADGRPPFLPFFLLASLAFDSNPMMRKRKRSSSRPAMTEADMPSAKVDARA